MISSEFKLIDQISRLLKSKDPSLLVGIGDDCAVVRADRKKLLLLTVDSLVESVHFDRRKFSPEKVGIKAMIAAVSDIAAMGGTPRWVLVSLSIPPQTSEEWVMRVYRGMQKVGGPNGVIVVGGNVSKSPRLISLHLTVVGEVRKEHLKRRKGARIGDRIYVSGPLGLSASGFYLSRPPLKEGKFLGSQKAVTSMIDVSDGLMADLGHIAKASRVGARIDYEKIPHPRSLRPPLVLGGGEDYVLLFTVSKGGERQFLRMAARRRFKFYAIGRVVPTKEGLKVVGQQGREITVHKSGFDHFK